MKKAMIIAPVLLDNISYVDELPRGNEELKLGETVQRADGFGYHTALFMSLFNFPYELLSDCASGVYGDWVYAECRNEGLDVKQNNTGTAGSTFHIVDRYGNYQYFCMPGAEYDFDEDLLEEIDLDQYSLIVLSGDMFCGNGTDGLMELLREAELPLYFRCGMRIDETASGVLPAVYALNPVLMLDEADAGYLYGSQADIDAIAAALYEKTKAPVIILKSGEGAYCNDGHETFIAPVDKPLNPDVFWPAFITARSAGVDLKNALVFAGECLDLGADEASLQRARRRLAGMITQK